MDELRDLFLVDGVVEGLTDAHVVEGLHQVVEVDVDGADARDVLDGHVRVRVDAGDVLRRHADGDMGLAGLDERHARRVFGNIQEAHARDAGLGAPVVLEAHEIDPLTALPVAELERAGADRVGGEVLAELRNDVRVDDGRRGVGEVREEGREGRREPELDGVLVDRDDLFDAVQEEREGEREVRVGEPLHAPHDDLGRQRSAVVEHDVVAQRDGPSEAVGRQLGARRQERHDLALGRQLVERLVHVAHDGRGRRVGRVVWVEGDCVGALGDDERPLGGRPSDQTNDGERDDELA